MSRFEDQVAVVTGAATGIGYGIARRLGSEGASVVMVDIDGELGEQASSELSARGVAALLTIGDVAEPETAERACRQALDEWGRVDILVNNAGIGGINGNIWELPSRRWTACTGRTCGAYSHSRTRWCPTCWSGTMGGWSISRPWRARRAIHEWRHTPRPRPPSSGLTKSVGKELAGTGIRVNCVHAAVVQTRILDEFTPEQVSYMVERIPMGRTGEIDEIAALVAWLASEECSFSTGAVFDITGGRATY